MNSFFPLAAAVAVMIFANAEASFAASTTAAQKTPTNHAATAHHGSHLAVTVGELEIHDAAIRATLPNAPVAAAYMTIRNHGDEDDRLLGGSAAFAGMVQLHDMVMENDVMNMRQVSDGLTIPAGQSVTLQAGGLHLMLMQLEARMQAGENRSITLFFEKAGAVTFDLPVKDMRGSAARHTDHDAARDAE
ncbi:copper chaperone PCu(A)C [Pseudohoeflea coraliihabitans]|uniref:Copper chaperone PCu(A)C n=1 Tax=Pseudohoeflea coraliihabitans TaxID=2860393 RepID=A0ABS6WMX3_9HYPH|nr:copper chaperone PCu(A)C [Pseudohoeflea sp. DP4N28-3]MBW3096762.1 copper chaperone PCu(A)C [Pseudohoeflea sp. DP4N28-3]